jgi:hypothetical protein
VKTCFRSEVRHFFSTGLATRINEVYGLSGEAQRDLMYQAILGYDTVHPDAPGDQPKFGAAVPPAKVEPKAEPPEIAYYGGWDD